MKAPIYIARRLTGDAVLDLQCLAARCDLEVEHDLHVTLAYSRAAVDWDLPVFDELDDHVHVSTEGAHFERFGACIVLVFRSKTISDRHEEFRAAGATWDFDVYNAHITIGTDREQRLDTLPDLSEIPESFVFGPEYKEELDLGPREDLLPAP